jgi:hypothetical protein
LFIKEVKLTTYSRHYEYSGVLHIHSRYSDGSGTMRKIIKAAKKAGLDYIVITDHNVLQAMENGAEGWYDGLLVLVGEEVGVPRSGHYLAFGISDTIEPKDNQEDARQYIKAAKRQGGIGFAAHPHGLHNTAFDLHLSPWHAWDDPDYTGIEVWSYMCDWAESVTRFNIFYYYFRPKKAIHGPPPDLLRRWDRLCQTRRVVGIGGSDAHARRLFPLHFIKFLSYERAFRGVRTHLLTPVPLNPDLGESKELIYAALASGHCFFAHDSLADSAGFSFRAFTDGGRKFPPLKKGGQGGFTMGDEVELESGVVLEATSPVPAALRLLRNGQLVQEAAEARQLTYRANEPGVYRVEARYNGEPWVFTNPIYLRGSMRQLIY